MDNNLIKIKNNKWENYSKIDHKNLSSHKKKNLTSRFQKKSDKVKKSLNQNKKFKNTNANNANLKIINHKEMRKQKSINLNSNMYIKLIRIKNNN